MELSRRYKVKARSEQSYEAACRILQENAEVLLTNAKRKTIAATNIDDETGKKLELIEAEIIEDYQYDHD